MKDFKLENKVVLVDFWAPWCRYCIILEPVLKSLEERLGENFSVVKINVDENPDIARSYGVLSLPTLMLFKDGKELNEDLRDRSEENLVKVISKHL
jgi:thioredoxin 1